MPTLTMLRLSLCSAHSRAFWWLRLPVGVALQTENGAWAWNLAKEARVEVRKVVWPTTQETTQTTLIVVGVVILVALILWALDSSLSWGVRGVIG